MNFDAIDKKKKLLERHRPFSKHTLKSLRENMLVEWTYNSNAIEGNTLTISETKVVLEGITVGGKSMREHLEVINHKDAILFLESYYADCPLRFWEFSNSLLLLKYNRNLLIAGSKKCRTKTVPHFFFDLEQNRSVSVLHSLEVIRHPT